VTDIRSTVSVPSAARRFRRAAARLALVALAAAPVPALANNYGESLAWQFMSPAERAAQIAMLDMIEKRRGGYYAAPIYNTNIARQYNCSITATAAGNSGAQTALANSPSVTGATSTATGNDSTTTIGDGRADTAVDGAQDNSGAITSGVTGSTRAVVQGVAWQALNSTQTNSGNQSSSVQNSNACAFGALN
jgi:uncharacterized protein YyaL (SSP411 family)